MKKQVNSRDVLEAKNRLIVERIKEIKHYTII